jgi:hypothetical protein
MLPSLAPFPSKILATHTLLGSQMLAATPLSSSTSSLCSSRAPRGEERLPGHGGAGVTPQPTSGRPTCRRRRGGELERATCALRHAATAGGGGAQEERPSAPLLQGGVSVRVLPPEGGSRLRVPEEYAPPRRKRFGTKKRRRRRPGPRRRSSCIHGETPRAAHDAHPHTPGEGADGLAAPGAGRGGSLAAPLPRVVHREVGSCRCRAGVRHRGRSMTRTRPHPHPQQESERYVSADAGPSLGKVGIEDRHRCSSRRGRSSGGRW